MRIRLLASLLALLGTMPLRAETGPLVLWFTNSPGIWQQDALPIGNGKLAAMVFCAVENEQIQFNEDTIWSGQPHFYEPTNASPAHLASIRAKVFSRTDIWSEASTCFMSQPVRLAAYQPAGVLQLSFPHAGAVNYRRSLDLNTGIVTVRYEHQGVTYTREVFAGAPSNRVLVVRLTASQPGRINLTCGMNTLQTGAFSIAGSDLIMDARVTASHRPEYFATGLTNAIHYQARVRVISEGGQFAAAGNSVVVTNADAATLLLGVASNFADFQNVTADQSTICSNNVAEAATCPFPQLRQAHIEDYQALFHRVSLDLGSTWKTNLPTGLRLRRVAEGDDPQLITLYYQLARYLMISGSRPGSQPLNLQGKWNDVIAPSWNSMMTLNINFALNYSGAEMCNLSECHQPLFEMVRDLSISGSRVARTNYNCDGWTAHHNTDLWRGAAPVNGRDGIWPTGGAWLCQNLWWHFQYTGDTNFLRDTAYPLMKGAAEFFLGSLVPHNSKTNWLVTNPSYSPEHSWVSGGVEVANVPGPTMDNELIRDLFDNVVTASRVLGIDDAFRTNVLVIRDKLPPNQIGRLGQLQEWIEDIDGATDAHRHMSHLVGLWPGDEISPIYTPSMAAAAKVSCDIRGNGDIGWGMAWRLGLRSRLQDGDRAYLILTNQIANSKISTNMVFHDNPNKQVDAIFGALSGVTEMFLQSQANELYLLPALPRVLTNGSVTGLLARGGFQVDINWQSNKLGSAQILSKLGNTCRVRSRWPIEVRLGADKVEAPMILPGLYEFATLSGSNYTILPASVLEAEDLQVTGSSGDAHQVLTNAAFSNLRGTRFNANALGDFVTYKLPNLAAGKYKVHVMADAGPARGQFQAACGPGGGVVTNLGPVHETYCPTNVVYLLPHNLSGPTVTALWTNMLREFDCGVWTVPASGDQQFKLTVAGKHTSSTGWNLSFDHIRLIPVEPDRTTSLDSWRADKFGANAVNPAVAGDEADPDEDGLPNLLEYGLQREPLVSETIPALGWQTGDYFAVFYQRALAATDIVIGVEVKTQAGAPWTTNVQPPFYTAGSNHLTRTEWVQDTVRMDAAQYRFMRLRAGRAGP